VSAVKILGGGLRGIWFVNLRLRNPARSMSPIRRTPDFRRLSRLRHRLEGEQARFTASACSVVDLTVIDAFWEVTDQVLGGVENRRSGGSLPVASWPGFRLAASVRFGLALFPVPAHRTGRAELPHPALGKDSRFRPRKAAGSLGYANQSEHVVQRFCRKALGSRPRYFVLRAQPLA
jgi:hypothetical protein